MKTTTTKSKTGKRTQHTPGPWEFVFGEGYEAAAAEPEVIIQNVVEDKSEVEERHIAFCFGPGATKDEQAVANYKLIAAAPELLEALKFARKTIKIWHGEVAWPEYQHSPEMKMINGAIAKAEGRT